MPDSAQVYFLRNQQEIRTARSWRVAANGGVATVIRAVNRSQEPVGRRRAQKPDYTITFEVDRLTGEPEHDWETMRDTHEVFTLTKVADARNIDYYACEVDNVEETTDDDGNDALSVTVSALRKKVY